MKPRPRLFQFIGFSLRLAVGGSLATQVVASPSTTYPLEVLPPEHKRMIDPSTGAELLFLTSSPAPDANLYFHEYSWLEDESVILFTSKRPQGGLMGYLTATGELIRFQSQQGGLGGATAAARGNAILALRGSDIVEVKLKIEPSADPVKRPSRVSAVERIVCTLQDGGTTTSLNPSCDGRYVAVGLGGFKDPKRGPCIARIDLKSGRVSTVCEFSAERGYAGHVQWSRTNPNLLSFAGGHDGGGGDIAGRAPASARPEDYATRGQRLWVVDIREGKPRNVYLAEEGELVTHESWWINDQILFCGGKSPKPAELSHVKVLDIYSGDVRIAGGGAWWPAATAAEAARLNWWHVSGAASGRWIAADNWHGDIMLFEGPTTRPHLLTSNHRTYGGGDHPHVGWDRKGEKVIFASHMLGNVDVCVATIPRAWQESVAAKPAGFPRSRR